MRRARHVFIAVLATSIFILTGFAEPASAHGSRYRHHHRAVPISTQQRAENINHTYVRVMEKWGSQAEWHCMERRINRESSFNHLQWNLEGSSALGIGQLLTKMHRLEGTPYMGVPDAATELDGIIYQINAMIVYVSGKYGRPCRIPRTGSY